MEMLLQADSLIRQTVPGVLDAAGMTGEAAELRGLDVLSCPCGLLRACELLQEIRACDGVPDEWSSLVEEAMFWAEAALVAAADEDRALYALCESKVRSAVEDGFASMILH